MKNKNLVLDIIVLVLIVGALVLAAFALKTPTAPTGKPVVLTMNVTRNADLIAKEAEKLGTVYFNSTDQPVKVIAVERTTRNKMPALQITLESKGSIEKDKLIFNGLRVLIGQKAEIHGSYFAQGVIQNVEYEK